MWDWVIVRKSVRGQGSIVTIPREYGAVRHPFVTKLLEDDKHSARLTDEEKELLVTWFDLQCPYFDTYMQPARVDGDNTLVRIKVDPWPAWGESRTHKVHYFQGK
jgi:hypothetical protein